MIDKTSTSINILEVCLRVMIFALVAILIAIPVSIALDLLGIL